MRLIGLDVAGGGTQGQVLRPACRHQRRAYGFALVALGALLAFLGCMMPFAVEPGPLALNHVEVTERIGTAGMPTRVQFDAIARAGYRVVINLAPPGAFGSHDDEGQLAARHGMRYHNVPVDFARPTVEDYARFAGVMREHAGERVLVHCQLNMRASSFVFLYRVLELKEDPDRAYDAVLRVWQPSSQWRGFMRDVLQSRGVPAPMALER